MWNIIILLILGFLAYRSIKSSDDELSELGNKLGSRLDRLWEVAHQGMRENKFVRAEKALLTILKMDNRNAAAYNRLGILYAKQKEYKDAIDCFEIATSIEPSSSSLHNLGLIYYETEKFDKASVAFEQALKLEDGLAARHIAYAKVQEKLGNTKHMLQELVRASELEPNPETYTLLYRAYDTLQMLPEAEEIQKKIKTLILPSGRPRRVLRPKRIVA